MGAPAINPMWLIPKLKEVEIVLCNEPCVHHECDMGICTHPLKLLREIIEECENI